jgi:uncharacterized protein
LAIAARFPAHEPLLVETGAPFGLIGVDFEARRRNRVNGRTESVGDDGVTLAIDEAFGNCPKYIAPRETFSGAGDSGVWTDRTELDDSARAMITRADVFFVATSGPDCVDISHRGGPPGFVALAPNGAMHIRDFPGNNYFNTLGNLLHAPAPHYCSWIFPPGLRPISPVKRGRISRLTSGSGILPPRGATLIFRASLWLSNDGDRA